MVDFYPRRGRKSRASSDRRPSRSPLATLVPAQRCRAGGDGPRIPSPARRKSAPKPHAASRRVRLQSRAGLRIDDAGLSSLGRGHLGDGARGALARRKSICCLERRDRRREHFADPDVFRAGRPSDAERPALRGGRGAARNRQQASATAIVDFKSASESFADLRPRFALPQRGAAIDFKG